MPISSLEMQKMIAELRSLRKYQGLEIPEATLHNLLEQELGLQRNSKDAVQAVRKKLHNIIAPYLGDPDYSSAALDLDAAFNASDPQSIRQVCSSILSTHASTLERLPILDEFYRRIFEFTGKPGSIMDLACGLNPFSFPWMGLNTTTRYTAYDLHQPRLNLIDHYFKLQGLAPLAIQQDILVDPPRQETDMAFFFKEAHRFEQRQRGCNRNFWQALNVHYLLVSLPTSSLSGKHNLLDRQRHLVYTTLEPFRWKVDEIIFSTEIVFCIEKS
jgi:16S rRNA (guanine(1405)-N(7))-methyltransferase